MIGSLQTNANVGSQIIIDWSIFRKLLNDVNNNGNFENNDNTFKLVLVIEADGKKFTVESEELKYEKTKKEPTGRDIITPPPSDNPTPSKKKCGKKSMELVISLVSIVTLFSFVLRKRR